MMCYNVATTENFLFNVKCSLWLGRASACTSASQEYAATGMKKNILKWNWNYKLEANKYAQMGKMNEFYATSKSHANA